MNKFNPIVEAMKRDDVDTLIDVLLSAMDIDINTDDKTAFKTIITNLPENATLLTLVNTIKSIDAKELGLSNTAYDAIKSVLVVLSHKGKHINDDYGHYFSTSN